MKYAFFPDDAMIQSGDSELFFSRRVCAVSNDITIKIPLNSKGDLLQLIFRFVYDGGKLEANFRGDKNGEIIFNLRNFGNSLGSGFTKPVTIGKLDDKPIDVMLFATKLPDGFPILDVNLFVGKSKNAESK